MAGRWAGDCHPCPSRGQTTVVPAAFDLGPLTLAAGFQLLYFDDARAVRRHLDGHLFWAWALGSDLREHQLGNRVFVVDAQQAMLRVLRSAWQRQEPDVIVVVAELPLLRVGRLTVHVKGRCVGRDAVSPGNHHLRQMSFGHGVGPGGARVVGWVQMGEFAGGVVAAVGL